MNGNLYHLEHCSKSQSVIVVDKNSKDRLWHRRYGHLGEQNLQKTEMFNYDVAKQVGFCETCVSGKHQRNPFVTRTTQSTEVLELVHSHVCGKMQERSPGGGEHFITFTDDKSRYRTDNGGEYTSTQFEKYLKEERI